MLKVVKFKQLKLDDEIVLIENYQGCLSIHIGVVTALTPYNELELNSNYWTELFEDDPVKILLTKRPK